MHPTSLKCNVPPEGEETAAHGGCDILIPEHCILQRGLKTHKNSLGCGQPSAAAPALCQTHAGFGAGGDHRECRVLLLWDKVEGAGGCHL